MLPIAAACSLRATGELHSSAKRGEDDRLSTGGEALASQGFCKAFGVVALVGAKGIGTVSSINGCSPPLPSCARNSHFLEVSFVPERVNALSV